MRNFVATCMLAYAASAFDFDSIKENLPFEWHTTKYELRQAQKAKGINYNIKHTQAHADRAHEAKIQNIQQRQRLGLAGSRQYGQSIAETGDGFQAAMLNFLIGMSFDGTANNSCFESTEDLLQSLDSTGRIITKLYNPANLAELQIVLQNNIVLGSDLYVTCALPNFFNTLTGLFTTEGISELQGRVIAAWPFQLRDARMAWENPDDYEISERYQRYGKFFSLAADYTL